jgi:cell division protein FtsN
MPPVEKYYKFDIREISEISLDNSYMVPRYLILLAILVVPGLISFGQSDSTLTSRQADFSTDLVMQVGAFRLEQNALALKDRLSANLEKPVIIVPEDGYFKVRVTGFKSLDEMEKIYPALGLLGMKNIWVVPVKKTEEIKSQVVVKPDTTQNAIEEKVELPPVAEEKPVIAEPEISLQAGVFHRKSKAFRARRRITTKLNLPVEIVQEWEYYKVIIPGFRSTEETHKYYPKLADMGYPDILLIENYKQNR